MKKDIFYIYPQMGRTAQAEIIPDKTAAIPAKFLIVNGQPVVDPNSGGSAQASVGWVSVSATHRFWKRHESRSFHSLLPSSQLSWRQDDMLIAFMYHRASEEGGEQKLIFFLTFR
jgi:hypothetical protein